MKLLYLANMRIPTEKAHGLQIMQNCEAFAEQDVEVTLWAARRVNTPALRTVRDYWAYYGVTRNFAVRRLPCLDLQRWAGNLRLLIRATFFLQAITYTLAVLIGALFTRADVYYSRDLATVLAISLIKPRHKIAYEVHRFSRSRVGKWAQKTAARRAGSVIAITPTLKADLEKSVTQQHSANDAASVEVGDKFLVAHDGIRRQRFANMPTQAAARRELGWPQTAFIVGYVGRLETLSMDKGVGLLVDALAAAPLRDMPEITLALVGGPEATAETLRARWARHGLPAENFLYAGQVAPERVPVYLAAFDLCAMPHPFTQQFAYYTSPLKLFEYMASRRAILASDLPGWADVVRHEDHALLLPSDDSTAWAAAVQRLKTDAALRERLAANAYERVMAHYTWDARAGAILRHVLDAAQRVK